MVAFFASRFVLLRGMRPPDRSGEYTPKPVKRARLVHEASRPASRILLQFAGAGDAMQVFSLLSTSFSWILADRTLRPRGLPVISYSCPQCRTFLTAHDRDAGNKLA